MEVSTRVARPDDIDDLVRLYRELEAEQAALRPLWPFADGLPAPIAGAFAALLDDDRSVVRIGTIDGVTLGFVHAAVEPLLPQAEGRTVGVVRLIFTEPAARGVGVGTTMVTAAIEDLRTRGVRLFDARVSPGHRHAKNFFEAHGFSARLIVMHHADDPDG